MTTTCKECKYLFENGALPGKDPIVCHVKTTDPACPSFARYDRPEQATKPPPPPVPKKKAPKKKKEVETPTYTSPYIYGLKYEDTGEDLDTA